MRWVSLKNELMHYGITGQHWGVRNYQNEDGSLTPAGKERYSVGASTSDPKKDIKVTRAMKSQYRLKKNLDQPIREKIKKEKEQGKQPNKYRQRMEEKYREQGFSKEDAEIEAYRSNERRKKVQIACGVAVGAALLYAGYKINKYIKGRADVNIKSGEFMQRITDSATEPVDRTGYIAFDKKDKTKYAGLLGEDRLKKGRHVYKVEMETTKDMKVAGKKTAEKVYKQLMRDDPEFKSAAEKVSKNWEFADKMHGNDKAPEYDKFNMHLVGVPNESDKHVRDKFFGKLKELGYSGVRDINDEKYSGYNAKKPVVLFNMKENIGERKISEIDASTIKKLHRHEVRKRIARSAGEALAEDSYKTAGMASAIAALNIADHHGQNKQIVSQQKRYNQIVNQYKKDHPNTRLSDKQILDNLLG